MRKVCVYTSTRAEFGLLSGLAREIARDPALTLQLLVSGTHLSPAHGETVREVVAAGFTPDACVPVLEPGGKDDPASTCRVMGRAISSYGEALARLAPDILVILGDRYEAFCCAAAAQICRIPVAHIHGGETTEGAVDEAFRHSITKMSHLHFPCCEEYRRRILQLGEDPARVYNVGALGVENIRKLKLMTRAELSASLGFPLDKPFLLVTFHPVTLEAHSGEEQIQALLEALEAFLSYKLIMTGSNADQGGSVIEARIQAFAAAQPDRVLRVQSLGQLRYLSAMRFCDAVVGNSSSGIIEAPAFKVPTVNIGDRQKGRVRAMSVIDCAPLSADIQRAIRRACSPEFRSALAEMTDPFDGGNTAANIVATLKSVPLAGILKKHFCDIPVPVPPTPVRSASVTHRISKKCLIIGYGSIGQRHAAVLEEMGCSVAVVSRHASLQERPCFRSVREALHSFCSDYAVICNRTGEHMVAVEELAACGFDGICMVEKPICSSTGQLVALPPFPAVVGYPLRFHPLMRAANEILAGKALLSLHAYVGQYLPTWRLGTDYRQGYSAHREQGGGVLRDLSHELDYLQVLGGPWQRVCASGGHRSALEIDSDDQFMMLIQLQSCRDVVCHVDYLSRTARRFCSIQYEGGSLWLDFMEDRLTHNGQTRLFEQDRNGMLAEMHWAVFESSGIGSCVCSWQEAVDTLCLVEAAEQSVVQERWICRDRP